jgi:hypothetical protein
VTRLRTAALLAGLAAGALVAPAGAELPVPTPIGAGPQFHPSAHNRAVARGLPVGRLRCGSDAPRVGVHLEVFARRRVVIVPAGIGIAPPLRRDGVYVRSGRCSYPVRTREPTGVVELHAGQAVTLGDLFAIWGRPLSTRRLLGFEAPPGTTVRVYVNGRLRLGDPRSVSLRAHDQVVLEVGAFVPPHASYRFPKGF